MSQSVIQSLSFVSQSCTDALAAIGSTENGQAGQLNVVLADVDALLALVFDITTKLALALNPVSPSYPAVLPLLTDLANYPPALAHCTRLLHDDVHGATLAKHLRSTAREIIRALRALVQTFLNNAEHVPQLTGTGAATDEYLVRTAALHDLITNARDTPKDNQTAVYRAWKSDRDTLDDSLQEIATMIKDARSDDPPDDIDDGWDDIGIGPSTRMDQHELARANNVHQLLRLTTLLHKRIFLDLLAHPSPAPVPAFDDLLVQSKLLLSTSDNLVSALYSPHDQAYIRAQILDLAKIATTLHLQLPVFFPPIDHLINQLRALTVNTAPAPSPSKKKADIKWFDTCVNQIVCQSSTATRSENPSSDSNTTQ